MNRTDPIKTGVAAELNPTANSFRQENCHDIPLA